MPTVSCTKSDKEWFEAFQEADESQADAFGRLVKLAKAYNGEPVDVDELATRLEPKVTTKIELGVYRAIAELNGEADIRMPEGLKE